MKKEYSDLPKSQQARHNLGTLIDMILVLVSMFIFGIGLVVDLTLTGKTWITDLPVVMYLIILGLGFSLMCGVFFAYAIKRALGLYTDIDLEQAEKRVQRIKDSLKD